MKKIKHGIKTLDACGGIRGVDDTSSSKIDSIKTYDFSTLYATIPHNKLKYPLFRSYIIVFKQKWHSEIQISSDWETRYIFS